MAGHESLPVAASVEKARRLVEMSRIADALRPQYPHQVTECAVLRNALDIYAKLLAGEPITIMQSPELLESAREIQGRVRKAMGS